jgi:anaerobic selenocysteine-containing dehydrogenase
MIRLRFGPQTGRPRPRLVQAETRPSDTARFADRWLALEPGTEEALALGIAHVILQEQLCDLREMRRRCRDFETGSARDYVSRVRAYDPDRVSRITGVDPGEIRKSAREFARETPSLALGGSLGQEAEAAVAGLNFLAGSVGRKGGVLFRAPVPETADPTLLAPASLSLRDVPDHSLRVLILDGSPEGGSLPWCDLETKLAKEGALVLSLSSYLAGHALQADYVLPGPAWMEGYEESGTPPGSSVPCFGISAPLTPAPPGSLDRAETIHRLAALSGISLPAASSEALLQERARAIHEAGVGEVFFPRDGERREVSAAGSPEGLWKDLTEGGCWTGAMGAEGTPESFRLLGESPEAFDVVSSPGPGEAAPRAAETAAFPLVLLPFCPTGLAGSEAVPLLASKLDRESGLKPATGCALVHPDTGRAAGLKDGGAAWMETSSLRLRVVARFDPSVKAGVVHLAVAPSGSGAVEVEQGATPASFPRSGAGCPERRLRARMREA